MRKTFALLLAFCLCTTLIPAAFAEKDTGAPYVNTTGEPVTLTVFCMMESTLQDYISGWNETPVYQKMEELTGVHIDFISPSSSTAKETLNMLMLSDELPDIIISSNLYANGIYQGYVDGYYLDLAPCMEEYAPDYWKIITSDDSIWRETVDDGGVISSFYRILQEPNPAYMRLVLKQEVMDRLSVDEVPVTIADWETLFEKMLNAGMVPFVLTSTGYDEKFMGAHDVMEDFYQVDGQIKYGQIEDGFRQYLELMHDWYEKGYISKDFVSISNVDTLFATEEIGTYDKPIVAAYNFGVSEGYTVLSTPYPRQTEDQFLHWDKYTGTMVKKDQNFGNIAISTSCENVEMAMKWINFRYTAPGIELINWGIEGLNFKYVDGEPQYLPAMWDYNNIAQEGLNYYFKGHNFATSAYSDTRCHANLLKSPEAAQIREEYGDDPLLDDAYYLPTISLTEEETELKSRIMTDIDTYVDEMVIKFIIGTESLENWDAYVETVLSMGLMEVVEVEQAGYDRYLSIVYTP